MIVGLTGGIGSGKTLVANFFKDLGAPVYISDVEAKKIMNTNTSVKQSIINLLGKQAYKGDELNKKFIASKVFDNKSLLTQLNRIVHPAVAIHFKEWYKAQKAPFVIKESAILFETKGNLKCNKVILVTAPETIRIARVMKRDGVSKQDVRKRIDNQLPDEEKQSYSDYVVENIVVSKTKERVKNIYKELLECSI